MQALTYLRAKSVEEAVDAVSADPANAFLAGGTTEVDLLRLNVTQASLLVDINRLPLRDVEDLGDGGLRIGALARMSDVARAPAVVRRFPGMSQALLLGASEQLRNMATMGGNLCQRVRCAYFRDGQSACNKRVPGSGCAALDGFNRGHAILGTSDQCIATHPSDVAVALVALDATVHTFGPDGARQIPVEDFFLLPGSTPSAEHPLDHGELITAIDVPGLPMAARSRYVKYRDRQSYEFALVSTFVALQVERGRISQVRVALGGLGTRPWRARLAEQVIAGAPPTRATLAAAADAELAPAVTRGANDFKVEFARRAMIRDLTAALPESVR